MNKNTNYNDYSRKADSFFKNKQFELAIEYYKTVVYYDKRNYEALYRLGLSYIEIGEKELGEEFVQEALQHYTPDD